MYSTSKQNSKQRYLSPSYKKGGVKQKTKEDEFKSNLILNGNEEKKLIRRVFESNNLEFSTKKVDEPYNDEISFDYQVGNVCIKKFSFKGKDLKRVIGSARQWSFVVDELGAQKKVLFIYDSDYEDMSNLDIIIKILSKNAKVLKLDDGMDYILKQCS